MVLIAVLLCCCLCMYAATKQITLKNNKVKLIGYIYIYITYKRVILLHSLGYCLLLFIIVYYYCG